MKKENKRLIYEALLVHEAYNKELEGYSDAMFYQQHNQNADFYRNFSKKINEIVGFNGQTIDEFISYVSAMELKPEQKKALHEIRKEPMFKKLMWEASLQKKTDLEKVLGIKITLNGKTFADEKGVYAMPKTIEELDKEWDLYGDKLEELLRLGTINEEQYDNSLQCLDYIYGYYISCSKGEQIPFRKLNTEQYKRVEERAMDNGISFDEEFRNETNEIRERHDELMELQEQNKKR